jgi:hypothetical protein
MQKWEYKYYFHNTGIVEQALNAFGEQGWELVAANDGRYFYFKRPKS